MTQFGGRLPYAAEWQIAESVFGYPRSSHWLGSTDGSSASAAMAAVVSATGWEYQTDWQTASYKYYCFLPIAG
jgi:hypothetical protein